MSTVKLVGWKPRFQKVSCTKIIRKHTGYGLAKGKKCTDDVLENKEVVISNLDENVAEQLLKEMTGMGVIAVVES